MSFILNGSIKASIKELLIIFCFSLEINATVK